MLVFNVFVLSEPTENARVLPETEMKIQSSKDDISEHICIVTNVRRNFA